jgi:putative ABC transport system ATP-binding protein
VCIFGTSGGGKTSLLNIIGTIDRPTKGDMKICGTRNVYFDGGHKKSFLVTIFSGITSRTPDRVLAELRLLKLYATASLSRPLTRTHTHTHTHTHNIEGYIN